MRPQVVISWRRLLYGQTGQTYRLRVAAADVYREESQCIFADGAGLGGGVGAAAADSEPAFAAVAEKRLIGVASGNQGRIHAGSKAARDFGCGRGGGAGRANRVDGMQHG